MRTTWKFQLKQELYQNIMVPEEYRFTHVAVQRGAICLWAEVDDAAPLVSRHIRMYGTGQSLPKKPTRDSIVDYYIGTVLLYDGDLVLHVYEHNHRVVPEASP